MKLGIFVALAALALVLFAVPDAYGMEGPGVNQRLSGSTFSTLDAETGNSTSKLIALAKGQPGTARAAAQLIWGPPLGIDPRCPPEFPFGSNVVSFLWVETYDDGSLLTGSASEGQAVCSDGVTFFADLIGSITGGTGRFEGASGGWQVEAQTVAPQAIAGTLMADLN
jgi:hypothetical protein